MSILMAIALTFMIGYPEQPEIGCQCTPLVTIQGRGVNIGKYTDPSNRLGAMKSLYTTGETNE